MDIKKEFTVTDVIELTKSKLENISVPAKYMKQIGIPILQCIDNLTACLEAVQKKEDTETEEPDVEEDTEQ